MTREEAKDLFRKNKDSYGKPRGIMGKVDKIYDEFQEQEDVLDQTIISMMNMIEEMRNVLRFCARNDVGTFYQQEAAREMLLKNTHIIWSHCNPDGTLTEKEKQWRYEVAEGREKGSGEKILKEIEEYEKKLKGE